MADASGSFSTDTASPVVADLLDSAYIDVKFTPWGVGDVGAVLRMTANGQNYDVYLGGKGSRPSGENDSSAPAFSKQSEIVSINVINNVTSGIFSNHKRML